MSSVQRMLGTALGATLLLGTTGCDLRPNDNVIPGQVAVGGDGYTVTIDFAHVENLVPNSPVMYRDATIGTVTGIELEDWAPQVTVRLLEGVELPANSTFTIGQKTLLGAQYVEVNTPEAPAEGRLGDGAAVPVGQTGGYPETEQVLAAAALLLNNGGLSQISTITGELSRALDDDPADAQGLIRRLDQLLETVNDNRGTIIAALEEINGLSGRLAKQRGDIARAIDEAAPALRVLNREQERLVSAVHSAGVLGRDTVDLVAATRSDLVGTLEALRPTLAHLSRASAKLPEALKFMVTLPFPIATSGQAIGGDFANLFATIDLTGSTLGENFGGYLLPSLQASNPLTNPLAPGGDDPLAGLTAPLLPLLDSVTPLLAPGQESGSSPGTPSDAPSGSCGLLSLLGGC